MNIKFVSFLILLFLIGCTGSNTLPNEPESVTIQWLEWLDKNNYKELKEISSGSTLDYVKDMEKFYTGYEGGEEEATIVENITCSNQGNGDVECIYCCNDGESETFILSKEKGQWKVKDIIVDIGDIDEEALRQEKQLEEMLNKKLPNE